MAFKTPLSWPAGWERTRKPVGTTFAASMATTMNDLENLVQQLKISDVVITTNQETRLDGSLRTAREATPDDTGVAFYFTREGQQLCLPCDKFNTVLGNLRAVGLTLEYIRRMEKYGTSQMVDAVFTGFTALPAQAGPSNHGPRAWHEVLGVSPDAPLEVRRAAYRALANSKHPDKGGSNDDWLELQKAAGEAGV